MGINGIREVGPRTVLRRPFEGEIVTDRFSTEYVVVNAGMKYANVRPKGMAGPITMLKFTDLIQTGEKEK